MADSPRDDLSHIRTPWLHAQSGASPSFQPDSTLPLSSAGSETSSLGARSRRNPLPRLICKGVAALGTIAALGFLAPTARDRGSREDADSWELAFEGDVHREESFSLHAGTLCFGVSEGEAVVGRIKLEVLSDIELEDVILQGDLAELQVRAADAGPHTRGGRPRTSAWMADNSSLERSEVDARGLPLYGGLGASGGTPELEREPTGFVAWGETVRGAVVYGLDELLVQVPGRGFLPGYLNGTQVLARKQAYLSARRQALRPLASLASFGSNRFVPGGAVVSGFPVANGSGEFVRVHEGGYLPKHIVGYPMLYDTWFPMTLPAWFDGYLTWMLFDDQETHWGAVEKSFNHSTLRKKTKASSQAATFSPLPWPGRKSFDASVGLREGFARHWHIVLNGDELVRGRPRNRYRVWARGHTKSFGPGDFHPDKCPGTPPLVWLERKFRQVYQGSISDYIAA